MKLQHVKPTLGLGPANAEVDRDPPDWCSWLRSEERNIAGLFDRRATKSRDSRTRRSINFRVCGPLALITMVAIMGSCDPGGSSPSDTDPSDADPGDTDPGDTDPSDTDPGDTDPGDTDPGDTDPGDTDPGDGGVDDGGGETPACLIGNPFDQERLADDLGYLADDAREGRAPGTAGDVQTRAYIADRFRCLGLIAADSAGNYSQPFTTSDGDETANVVGYIAGTDLPSEAILMGAHHDHLGIVGGKIHNGANDNASGVAALLAVALAVKQRATPPRRTIIFVAFGFEENDGKCVGSEHYAANAPSALPIDEVVYMINGDMLGTYNQEEELTAYGSLKGTPARTILNDLLPGYPSLDTDLGDSAGQDDSDFQAFCNRGIPYIYLETWDSDCLHEPCDDTSRIDFPNLSTISRLLGDIALELADTETDLAGVSMNGCSGH